MLLKLLISLIGLAWPLDTKSRRKVVLLFENQPNQIDGRISLNKMWVKLGSGQQGQMDMDKKTDRSVSKLCFSEVPWQFSSATDFE